jgi:mono/diheme cytochrome c family protein
MTDAFVRSTSCELSLSAIRPAAIGGIGCRRSGYFVDREFNLSDPPTMSGGTADQTIMLVSSLMKKDYTMPRQGIANPVSTAAWISLFACMSCSSNDTDNPSSTGDVTAGKAAVTKYACTNCHGADLSGTTTVYPGTTAYPANLTPDKDSGIGEWDLDTIKAAILTGKDDEGKTLCSTMPVFRKMGMTDTEATNIAAYLKSLPAVSKDVPESECGTGTAGSGAAGSGK